MPRRGAFTSASRGSTSTRSVAWKDQVVGKLTGGTGPAAQAAQGAVRAGRARRSSTPTTFEVETARGARTRHLQHAILATGSRPATVPSARDRTARA